LFNTGKVKYHIKHSNAIERVHSDNKTKNQAKKKKSTVEEEEVIPQPVSPMMRVTRFC
jgi:hypothetical protein